MADQLIAPNISDQRRGVNIFRMFRLRRIGSSVTSLLSVASFVIIVDREGIKMLKANLYLLLLLSIFITVGCQNTNLNLNKNVTEIQVVDWETEEPVAKIKDGQFIQEIVEELDNAKTYSTATMDFVMPDYKLVFKNDEEVLYEIGYYKKVMRLGIEGRYWEFDKIYGVTQELPVSIEKKAP